MGNGQAHNPTPRSTDISGLLYRTISKFFDWEFLFMEEVLEFEHENKVNRIKNALKIIGFFILIRLRSLYGFQ